MRVGLNASSLNTASEVARTAEGLGYDFIGSGEHIFFHGPSSNAFIQLAAAAGATSSIRLVSSIALLPLYPAALAVKMASTLDRVSGGRFEFGVGSGGEYPKEFQAVGVDPATRFRRLDEALVIARELFSGERVTFKGEFNELDDVRLDPPPVQPGGPPIWVGGRKTGARRRAGRLADVWMPYMVDPKAMRESLAEVNQHALDAGRPDGAVSGALFAWTCVDAGGDWARETGIKMVSEAYAQDFAPLADRYLILGSPDEVISRLSEFAEAGADRVLIQVAAKGDDRTRAIDAFARHVLPALRDL